MSEPDIAVIMLAAGNSTRMAGPNKLLMPWRGKPLIASSVSKFANQAFTRRISVSGRDSLQVTKAANLGPDWDVIHNRYAGTGLASSLKLGLRALETNQIAVVALGDMPDVSSSVIASLCNAWLSTAYALVPTYQQTWGNPVLLGTQAIVDCLSLKGDRGARALLLARSSDCLEVETNCPGILFDVDTPADFAG